MSAEGLAGSRQRRAGEALLGSEDPILREIGAQVRDGRIRLVEALRIPAYAEAFANAAQRVAARLEEQTR